MPFEDTPKTFRKCDLHVHSSSCESRNYNVDDFKSILISSSLDVVAVTDHNVVDAQLLSELNTALNSSGKALLAGVELNVYIDEETIKEYDLELSGKSDYFHGVVWCDAKDAEMLQSAVLSLLDGIGIDASEREGKTAKEISALSKGKAFSHRSIQDAFGTIRHIFVFHESKGDDKRNLSGYLKKGVAANERFKDKLFYYNQNLAVEGGKKSRKISDWFEANLNTTVTTFFFSDAKTLGDIGAKFTWIDFDGDLDSLNLAVTDPESRIVTSDTSRSMPQRNISRFLRSVRFRDSVGKLVEIEFSPSYNGIIGSRGSGKSMLAHILASKDLETYASFIDTSSIQYRCEGGEYSSNSPKVLYLKQGDFGQVFAGSKYENVPFLSEKLSPMREGAETVSAENFDAVKQLLDAEKALLTAFIEKYPSKALKPDVYLHKKPAGIGLVVPPSSSFDSPVDLARSTFTAAQDQIDELRKTFDGVIFKSSLPEYLEASLALDERTKKIVAQIDALQADVRDMIACLDAAPEEPLMTRVLLARQFKVEAQSNNSKNSNELSQYIESVATVNEFYLDLLNLRIALMHADRTIEGYVSKMLSPIDPEKYQCGGAEVIIGVMFKNASDYETCRKSQFPSACPEIANQLIEAALLNSEPSKVKALFNGTKYRGLATTQSYLDKYFNNIEKGISENMMLEVTVSVDGKKLDEMSPGMQAQCLLKMLLEDDITSGDYMYVILDQPEDNLDIPTIREVLINRVKTLKKDIQFFVVSHSAPVVINGDARTVVIASESGGLINYKCGPINGIDVKQEIATVLDGGERYLKMRLYKYDFQEDDQRD